VPIALSFTAACDGSASRSLPHPRSTNRFMIPCHLLRIGLHRTHACTAAFSVEAIAYGMSADRKLIARDAEKSVRRMRAALDTAPVSERPHAHPEPA
jgi:hypothetical protein